MITDKHPDDLTLEEIKTMLAYYNRLYYYKVRDDEAYKAKKRQNALNTAHRKRLDKMIEESGIEMAPEEQKPKQKTGFPRKYKFEDYGLKMPSGVE